MIIKTLVENTSASKKLIPEHGLSLYIETEHEKILFDTGASSLFQQNALKMDVKIDTVDILVISHGHNDHGGGLLMGRAPDTVIGGFHLSSRTTGNERSESIHQIGNYLKKTQAVFYTGHCTGTEPYNQLRSILGEQINHLSTGSKISI